MVTTERPRVTKEKESQQTLTGEKTPRKCVGCSREESQIFRCSKCHAGLYCSKDCQKKEWQAHKDLCACIFQLDSQLREDSQLKDSLLKEKGFVNAVFSSRSRLTLKEEIRLVKLVGQRCTVDCLLDGVASEALWDTGAEVALVGQKWLQEKFPGRKINDVSKLLGQEFSQGCK